MTSPRDALQAALDAGPTPGPWRVAEDAQLVARDPTPDALDGDEWHVASVDSDADADLIVAAVNALPALLDVVEAARRVMDDHSCGYAHESMEALADALDRLEATDGR